MGGLASPQLSHSQGFADLLAPLGLKTTRLYPALTQLKCNSPLPKALQGIKFNGQAALWQADELLAEAEGEILFAAYGLSGPPILQLSRWAARNFYANSQPAAQEIQLDLLPQMSRAELLAELSARRALPLLLEDFLTGLLNKRLGQQLLKLLPGERKLSAPAGSLTEADLAALAALIKALPLAVCGVTGWERAQVMAGGLELKGFAKLWRPAGCPVCLRLGNCWMFAATAAATTSAGPGAAAGWRLIPPCNIFCLIKELQ